MFCERIKAEAASLPNTQVIVRDTGEKCYARNTFILSLTFIIRMGSRDGHGELDI